MLTGGCPAPATSRQRRVPSIATPPTWLPGFSHWPSSHRCLRRRVCWPLLRSAVSARAGGDRLAPAPGWGRAAGTPHFVSPVLWRRCGLPLTLLCLRLRSGPLQRLSGTAKHRCRNPRNWAGRRTTAAPLISAKMTSSSCMKARLDPCGFGVLGSDALGLTDQRGRHRLSVPDISGCCVCRRTENGESQP